MSRERLQSFIHHCLECLDNLDFFAFFDHTLPIIEPNCLMTLSSLLGSLMLVVSKPLKFEMTSLINPDSCSLLGAKINFDVWTISLDKGIVTVREV